MNVATDKAPTLQTKWVYISQFCYLSYCSKKKKKQMENAGEVESVCVSERASEKRNKSLSIFFLSSF